MVVVVALLVAVAEPAADELLEDEDEAADVLLPLSVFGIAVIIALVAVHDEVGAPEVADEGISLGSTAVNGVVTA